MRCSTPSKEVADLGLNSDGLQLSLNETKDQLDHHETIDHDLRNRITELHSSLDSHQVINRDLCDQIKGLRLSLNEQKNMSQDNQDQVNGLHFSLQNPRIMNQNLRDQVRDLQDQVQDLQSSLQNTKCELEKHEAVNHNLRAETEDLTERIEHCHRLQDQIDDLHVALGDARAELEQQKAMDQDNRDHDEAAPSPNSVVRSMNTTALRALGTTKPTIMPSAGAAVFITVNDAKLINLSSDSLPNEILHQLRTNLTHWNSRSKTKPAFTWTTVQSNSIGRSCIETRMEKKKSQWVDGAAYACTLCEQRRRLCLVVESAERVLQLSRKAAENEGHSPKEIIYWRR